MRRAVVLFSGGMDSTVCLIWALKQFDEVVALSFNYGQTCIDEITRAKKIAKKFKVRHQILTLDFFKDFSNVSLIKGFKASQDSIVLPGRNLIFLSVAASFATSIEAFNLIIGSIELEADMLDCSHLFMNATQKAIMLGVDSNFVIHRPLEQLHKQQIFALANELGYLDLVINETLSCYSNKLKLNYEWGTGCGECIACYGRKSGYQRFKNNSALPGFPSIVPAKNSSALNDVDLKVWNLLLSIQTPFVEKYAPNFIIKNLKKVRLQKNIIPTVRSYNNEVFTDSDWKIVGSQKNNFEQNLRSLLNKKIIAAKGMRKSNEFDQSYSYDYFYVFFGLGLNLLSVEVSKLVLIIAELDSKICKIYPDPKHPSRLKVQSIAWFVWANGLIEQNKKVKCFGPNLLSNPIDMKIALSSKSKKKRINIDEISNEPIRLNLPIVYVAKSIKEIQTKLIEFDKKWEKSGYS